MEEIILQKTHLRSTLSPCRAVLRTSIYNRSFNMISVFVLQVLLSLLRFYNCFLRLLNSCDNMGYIFLICIVGTQPTGLKWLGFMYAISNSPTRTIMITNMSRCNLVIVLLLTFLLSLKLIFRPCSLFILSFVVSTSTIKAWKFKFHGFNSLFEVHQNRRYQFVKFKVWSSFLVRYVGELRDSHRFSKSVWVITSWCRCQPHFLKELLKPVPPDFRQT